MKLFWNGNSVTEDAAVLPFFSPAVQFGLGVFETMRTYHGKIFSREEHLERLRRSAMLLGFRMPHPIEKIGDWLDAAVADGGTGDIRIKLVVVPEGVMVRVESLVIDSAVGTGVTAKSVFRDRAMPEAKTLSYVDAYIAHEMAVRDDFFEAILTDRDGNVTEGAYSNLFWFDGEKLSTREDGVLPGITRDLLLEHSCFPLKMQTRTLRELCQSEEIFLTSSTYGIAPVIKIDDVEIGDGKVGAKTKKLIKVFDQLTSQSS